MIRPVFPFATAVSTLYCLAPALIYAQVEPPAGVPHKLNVCETLQTITQCADWVWNGHEFEFDYGKSAGTGTIVRNGQSEIILSRVDTKDPWFAKGITAEYFGTIDGSHSGHGTVKWIIKGRPPAQGTWTATFMPNAIAAAKPDSSMEEPVLLPPPPPGTSPLPMPLGLQECEGECIQKSDGNVALWIFHGMSGDGRWSRFGQRANLTILRYDANGVIIRREDTPTSSHPGQTAVYTGTVSGSRIEGIATLNNIGPDSQLQSRKMRWLATIPVASCKPPSPASGEEALEFGGNAAAFRDMPAAFQCFLVAAEQGNGQAKFFVGLMYRDGIGTQVNYPEALRWLNVAAIQGEYNAQLALEQVYEFGLGTTQNSTIAEKWKKASQNNPTLLAAKASAEERRENKQLMVMGLSAVLAAAVRPAVYIY